MAFKKLRATKAGEEHDESTIMYLKRTTLKVQRELRFKTRRHLYQTTRQLAHKMQSCKYNSKHKMYTFKKYVECRPEPHLPLSFYPAFP